MRLCRLSFTLTRRAPLRGLVLAFLTAAAIIIFLLASELSRISQEGLESALVREEGLTGSYEIAFVPSEASLTRDGARDIVDQIAKSLDFHVWGEWEDLPPVRSECPPYNVVGEQTMRVLWQKPGVAYPLPFGETGGLDTRWCIDGQSIPPTALYLPDDQDEAVFGTRLYLRPEYERMVMLSTTEPTTSGWVVVTGDLDDVSDTIRGAVSAKLASIAASAQIDPLTMFTITRIDQDGLGIRETSRGVSLTYDLIRWGVLLLGGLSVVAVQTIIVRQRSWFYGLLVSMGVRIRRLSVMLMIDTMTLILVALGVALVILRATSPVVDSFAEQTFGVEANLLSAGSVAQVAAGMIMTLGVTLAAGLMSISRHDPLATLEAPRD